MQSNIVPKYRIDITAIYSIYISKQIVILVINSLRAPAGIPIIE